MNLTNTMICWKRGTGEMMLCKWPDKTGRSRGWSTIGACFHETRKSSFDERKFRVFIEAVHLIVRDKLDPQKLHEMLLRLDEYRDGCSDDMPGDIR